MQLTYKTLFATLVLAALVVWGALSLASAPTSAAEEFMGYLQQGDLDQAYQVSAVEFKQEIDIYELEDFLRIFPELNGYREVQFTSRQVIGNEARVTGQVITQSGEQYPVVIDLVKKPGLANLLDHGGWEVSLIDYR